MSSTSPTSTPSKFLYLLGSGLALVTALLIYQTSQIHSLRKAVDEKPKKLILEVDAKALAESGVTLIPDELLIQKLDQLNAIWNASAEKRIAVDAALKEEVDTKLNTLLSSWKIEKEAREADVLARSDRVSATRTLAQTALKAGQADLAQIFLVNALDYTNGDIEVLSEYTTALLSEPNSPEGLTRIRQGINVLEAAAYRVKPDAVRVVLTSLEKVQAREAAILAAITPAAPKPSEQFAAITKTSLEKIQMDLGELRNRSAQLAGLVSQLEEEDKTSKLFTDALNAYKATQATLSGRELLEAAKVRLNNLDDAITRFDAEGEKGNAMVTASMQSLEALVNTVPSLDLNQMPSVTAQALRELAGKQAAQVAKAQKINSLRLLTEIEAIVRAAEALTRKPQYTEYLKKLDLITEPASRRIRQISDESLAPKVLSLNQRLAELYREGRAAQSNAYQLWAVDKARKILTKKNSTKVWTDNDANTAFYDYKLAEVDQRLLAPETAKFFDESLQEILGEVPAKWKADLQRVLAFGNSKKTLEDF